MRYIEKLEVLIFSIVFSIGLSLMGINLFGLTQTLRYPELISDPEKLRFVPDQVLSYSESMSEIEALRGVESRSELSKLANLLVNKSLVHVDWERVDPVLFRQLIPIWENYFLYALGKFSNLPQFERYHFSNYKRNILRGIGICGDAATTLSSILDLYDIPNQIISFQGHVILEYFDEKGAGLLLDPDFGVSLGVDLESLVFDPESVRDIYRIKGYSDKEVDFLLNAYYRSYTVFDDAYSFMKKRYIFEEISYILKWVMPIALIVFSLFGMVRVFHGINRRREIVCQRRESAV